MWQKIARDSELNIEPSLCSTCDKKLLRQSRWVVSFDKRRTVKSRKYVNYIKLVFNIFKEEKCE